MVCGEMREYSGFALSRKLQLLIVLEGIGNRRDSGTSSCRETVFRARITSRWGVQRKEWMKY